jgi:hypothetical protein
MEFTSISARNRIWQTGNVALKNQTPAMASGITDHVWTIKEPIERAA